MPTSLSPISDRVSDSGSPTALHLTQRIEEICLAERVAHALRRTGHSALRDIGISDRHGLVVLHGRVASYHLKQLAQEAVRQVFVDAIIKNELEVIRPD